MYLGETEEYKEELAMIIEEMLIQRTQGMKNEKGVYITPAFPKLLYVLEEDNIRKDSKYYYLTELAAKCTAKRLVPDYISEKMMKKLEQKEGYTQELITPIVVSLSGREMEVLQMHSNVFEKIGFRIENFGDREYLITGVPSDFLNIASKELFIELLDGLMKENSTSQPEMVLERCASMACKAAVKGNHLMSYTEAKHLIEQMLQMEQPYHCPHGRPTAITMSKYELEKKFKRII